MTLVLILPEMTWPDAKEALARAELAIVPVGSFEQHGPYMTFESDAARAWGLGKMLAERLYPRVILAPTVTFGVSQDHMRFPGTITLRPETFQSVIYDVGWSLRQHGLRQIYFLSGHGGNRASLQLAMIRLRDELGIRSATSTISPLARRVLQQRLTTAINGHACEDEVAQALILSPHVVKRERLVPAVLKGYPYKSLGKKNNPFTVPYRFDELTENGGTGDATLANEELGKEIIQEAIETATEFLIDFMDTNARLDAAEKG
jgi:creatinine amidohydrolase